MKIQTKRYGVDIYVIGFYVEGGSLQILYITRAVDQIQRREIDEDDSIIDNEIDPGFIYAKMLNIEGVFHHYLVENPDFLLKSLEGEDFSRHDDFLSVLIAEKLIPSHFYTGIDKCKTALEWLGEEYRKEWGAK